MGVCQGLAWEPLKRSMTVLAVKGMAGEVPSGHTLTPLCGHGPAGSHIPFSTGASVGAPEKGGRGQSGERSAQGDNSWLGGQAQGWSGGGGAEGGKGRGRSLAASSDLLR